MPVPPPHAPSISTKLPVDVLARICGAALAAADDSVSAASPAADGPLSLLVVDSHWHKAVSRVLYRELLLEDDDELLLLAAAAAAAELDSEAARPSEPSRDSRSPRVVQQLRAIMANPVYADSVRVLKVVPGLDAWRYASPDRSVETLSDVSLRSQVQ